MRLIVIGAGGHAKAVIASAELMNIWTDIKIVDEVMISDNEEILGYEVEKIILRKNKYVFKKNSMIFVAIGDISKRKKIIEQIDNQGHPIANIINPTSLIHKTVKIGLGNYVGPHVHIGPEVVIGDGNIINTAANIEHESIVGSYTNISPSAIVCGKCHIESEVFIGANASILEGRRIERKIVIGAGAVVNKNLTKVSGKYLGIPARLI